MFNQKQYEEYYNKSFYAKQAALIWSVSSKNVYVVSLAPLTQNVTLHENEDTANRVILE